MERNLKDKIIAGSVKLFNERGINQTSFRNIAELLKISDGHIRYYFKTKESLLLAIFNKMNNDILLFAQQSKNDTLDTKDLKNKLKEAFNIMVSYSFFFVESPKTINQFSELNRAYKNLVIDRKSLFLNLFQSLTKEGLFKETFSTELQESAFYSIFIISDSWIRYYIILNNREPNKEAIDFHSNLVFSILLPYIKV